MVFIRTIDAECFPFYLYFLPILCYNACDNNT